MTAQQRGLRSAPAWLFVPGDRPDRYSKAAQRSDVVIVDLEDAVAPEAKPAARDALRSAELDPTRTVIRINAAGTPHYDADLALLEELPYTHIMVPKAESAEDAAALGGRSVIALIETARGAAKIAEIAGASDVVGLMWGAEDLIADLGGGSSRDRTGSYRDIVRHVRASTLLAGRAHGKWVLDSIWTAIDDLAGLAAEAEDAVESGFAGKVSIHPAHVPVVRRAFAPRPDQVVWAREVLELAQTSHGAFSHRAR